MRSFNFSRLARSTCCQRPKHVPPERRVQSKPGRREAKPVLETLPTTSRRRDLANLSTLPRFLMPVNPSSRRIRSCESRLARGASTPALGRRSARAKGSSRRANPVFQGCTNPRGKNPKLKISLEVLRLTRNPSGSLVPEYGPRGRSQFLTGLLYQMYQSWQGLKFFNTFSGVPDWIPAPLPGFKASLRNQ
jgi:hypothetical protein